MAQPDIHPDADLLNGFVEQALPEAERIRLVGHLAGCTRCREVVYLAQAAAEEMIVPTAAVKPEPQPGWLSAAFARWRAALIPAAALAAVGGIVLWVQLHPASPPVEMAQLTSPRPQASGQQASPAVNDHKAAIAPKERMSAAPKSHQAEPLPAPKQRKPPTSADGIAATSQFAPNHAAAAPALPSPVVPNRAAGGIHLDGRSAAMARYAPSQPATASSASTYRAPQPQPNPEANGQPVVAAAPPLPPAPAPASGAASVVAVHGETAAAPVGAPSQAAVQSLQQVDVVPQPMSGLPLLRLARRAKLPSGLNTVSSAVLLNRLVAVDSEGSVFLSQDGGKRWEHVLPPWSGKAVEVNAPPPALYRLMPAVEDRSREMAPVAAQSSMDAAATKSTKDVPAPLPPSSGANSSPASATRAKTASPNPALLFKLVTDHHQVWVSPDGKIWREQ
jgi:hypothetical protein